MAGHFTWNGPSVQARIENEVQARLRASAEVVRKEAERLVSTPAGPTRHRGAATRGLRSGRRPPSFVIDADGMEVGIGNSASQRMGRPGTQPVLLRALIETTPEIRRILTAPLRSIG